MLVAAVYDQRISTMSGPIQILGSAQYDHNMSELDKDQDGIGIPGN